MYIDYAINAIILVLKGYVILDGTKIVTDVLPTGRASTGKDTLFHNLLKFITKLLAATNRITLVTYNA
jgi:hypothetical protein